MQLQEVINTTGGTFDAEAVAIAAQTGLRRLAALAHRPYRTMCQAEHLVNKTLRQARGKRVDKQQQQNSGV